jgi:hypothetical protein
VATAPLTPANPDATSEPMKPWLHVSLANRLDGDVGIRRAIRNRSTEELEEMVRGIAHHARTLPGVLMAFGLPALEPEDELWQSQVLPLLRVELERRSRPLPPPGSGLIARLKTLDIIGVASRFTDLVGGGDKMMGRCPLHDERTASFYVYADSQRWHVPPEATS